MGRYSAIGCVLFISHLFHSGLSLARAWSSQVVVCVRVCARAQLCPTLCNPLDWSPPGSSIHGIFQARIQNGLPFPPPGDLPDPGIKPTSFALQGSYISDNFLMYQNVKMIFCYILFAQW